MSFVYQSHKLKPVLIGLTIAQLYFFLTLQHDHLFLRRRAWGLQFILAKPFTQKHYSPKSHNYLRYG